MSGSGVFPAEAERYLAEVAAALERAAPLDVVRHVERLVRDQDAWRVGACLNLNPAESGMSRRARALLDSDLATRVGEGPPGARLYPRGLQNAAIDEIEATAIALARRLFGAAHVEWRPASTSMANAAVFLALLKPGDVVIAQSEDGGGNYSYQPAGPLGLCGARIVPAPWRGDAFEVDLDAVERLAREVRPRMIVVGGSNVLFPYPVAELRRIADAHGALLLYDAAHLGLFLTEGAFQQPLAEGAHVVTLSTHKVMGGPVGGMVLTDDTEIARRLSQVVFPGLLQTRDQNKYAALAVSLAECAAFGEALARRMVDNARALASAFAAEGFAPIGAERGCSDCHQLFLRLGEGADAFEARCQGAGMLLASAQLVGDPSRGRRTGARLATHEVTRQGMGEAEMAEIAAFARRAGLDGEDPALVAGDVRALVERFPGQPFSFDCDTASVVPSWCNAEISA